MTELTTKLEYALAYSQKGYHIFPVWWAKEDGTCACGKPDCSSVGKHPIGTLTPKGMADASIDVATIRNWWLMVPYANIAVNLAKSGLCCVDIDPRNGGAETLDALTAKHGALSTDVYQFSGGSGEHYFFLKPEDLSSLPGTLGPGVDMLLNKYVLLEPSNHKSGGTYEWEASSSPLEGNAPGPLPDWIRDLGREVTERPSVGVSAYRFADAKLLRDIRDALRYLDYDDRDTWIKCGLALCELGQEGFDLWDEWSFKSEKYRPGECRQKWNGFRPGSGLSVESVFYNSKRERSRGVQARYDVSSEWENYDINQINLADTPDDSRIGRIRVQPAYGREIYNPNWLWEPYIPRGEITILAGSPASGKTTAWISLAAALTGERTLPDGHVVEKCSVLYYSAEDSYETCIGAKFLASGGDDMCFYEAEAISDSKTGALRVFDPRHDFEALGEECVQRGNIDLLVIDNIADSILGDSNSNADVRSSLIRLREIAQTHNFAILGVSHLRKGSQGTAAAERVLGSTAFVSVPRTVFSLERGENGNPSVFIASKANYSKVGLGFTYTVEPTTIQGSGGAVVKTAITKWGEAFETDENITKFVERMTTGVPDDVKSESGYSSAVAQCAAWLTERIGRTWVASKAIEQEAYDAGYSESVYKRARKLVDVDAKKEGNVWFTKLKE
jgi:putative DNA primase/helicase